MLQLHNEPYPDMWWWHDLRFNLGLEVPRLAHTHTHTHTVNTNKFISYLYAGNEDDNRRINFQMQNV